MIFDENITPKDAILLQNELRSEISLKKLDKLPHLIAGTDISFNFKDPTAYAGIVLLSYPEMKLVGHSLVKVKVKFPYVSGLLSFREVPALLLAWENLQRKPDLVILDGQGIAHPRRIGLASHFGLIVEKPTIGCAKSLLVGKYEEPEILAGSFSILFDKGEQIGIVFRTKDKVKPIFISPGNLVDFEDSLSIVRNCVRKHRIPEPTRQAHLLVNRFRKGEVGEGYCEY